MQKVTPTDMVYVSFVRSAIPRRIPTIKFRKGGGNGISSASEGFIAATVATGKGSAGSAVSFLSFFVYIIKGEKVVLIAANF